VQFVLAFFLTLVAPLQAAGPAMTVYKTKTCGCCAKWVDHMRAAGFSVKVNEVDSTAPARQANGVPERLASCHTATVGGYSIEGHVPAADIQRLLREKPRAKGLAVPGMPMGSPGMEGPYSDAYAVLLFEDGGHTSVFQRYAAKR
jgi:hypothetical protein